MKRKRRLPGLAFGIAAAAVLLLPGAAESQTPRTAAQPLSAFGLELFKSVSQGSQKSNVVFSPLSAALAIALVSEGARAETRTEFLRALGVDAAGWDNFSRSIGRLLEDVRSDTGAVARIATSLWVDEGRVLAPEFSNRAQRNHHATASVVDLQSPAARAAVDRWASEHTEGRITKVMPDPRDDMVLVLLNAVYFKGLWPEPFDSARTLPRPFLISGRDSVNVPTMHRHGQYGYFETPTVTGVRMPYKGGRFATYLALPRNAGVAELVRRINPAAIQSWADQAGSRPISLYVPRFTHRGRWDLIEPLKLTGIQRAFSPKDSELDGLWTRPVAGQKTVISDAAQSTFIQFDEKGTEAAAVTVIGAVVTSVPPPPLEFRVDRPFLLVLRDEQTGAILFIARIGNPLDKGE